MSDTALHEPAILHLIFLELKQRDLLLIQRVCQAWRTTITTNKKLLAIQFLSPDPSDTPHDEVRMNPCLNGLFIGAWDYSSKGFEDFPNIGPWRYFLREYPYGPVDPVRMKRFMYPEASWRRMLPCRPAPTQLQVHVDKRDDGGKVLWLDFPNRNSQPEAHEPACRDPWLTFGLLHDLMEAAWFHGEPEFWNIMGLVFPGQKQYTCSPIRREAQVSDELSLETKPRPGRVMLNSWAEDGSREEGMRQREARRRQAAEDEKKPRLKRQRRGGVPQKFFTDEFHFPDGRSLSDVAWSEVAAYSGLRPPTPQPPPPRHQRRRFLGIPLRIK